MFAWNLINKDMPTLFELLGMRFYFYSLEHRPIHAETEFEKYRVIQDQLYLSDYDRFLLEMKEAME